MDSVFEYYKILGLIICGLLVINLCLYRKKALIAIAFITFIILGFWSYLDNIITIGRIYNHTLSFVNVILLIMYFTMQDNIEYFKKCVVFYRDKIYLMLISINIIEIIFFISKKGFVYTWEGNYFQGTNRMPHTFSYLMLVLIIISFFCYELFKEKKYIYQAIFPIIGIMFSGARTTLGGLIIFLLIVIIRKLSFKNIIKIFCYGGLIFIIFNKIILNFPMFDKFKRQISYGMFTSGRDIFATNIMSYFDNLPISQKLIGIGADKTYYINLMATNQDLWAHNDFIQVIVSFGIIGLTIYIYYLFKLFIFNNKISNSLIQSLLVLTLIVFLAYMNGFYNYRDFPLAIPYIILYLSTNKKEMKYNQKY